MIVNLKGLTFNQYKLILDDVLRLYVEADIDVRDCKDEGKQFEDIHNVYSTITIKSLYNRGVFTKRLYKLFYTNAGVVCNIGFHIKVNPAVKSYLTKNEKIQDLIDADNIELAYQISKGLKLFKEVELPVDLVRFRRASPDINLYYKLIKENTNIEFFKFINNIIDGNQRF